MTRSAPRLRCVECGEPVDYRRPGVAREVIGWAQNRTGGGTNHVIEQRPTGRWLCRMCADAHRVNANPSPHPGLFT
jgi:hypothetical protein